MKPDEIREAVENAEVTIHPVSGTMLFQGIGWCARGEAISGSTDRVMPTDEAWLHIYAMHARARPIFAALDLLSPTKGWIFEVSATGQGWFVRTHNRASSLCVWREDNQVISRGAMPQHRAAAELLWATFGPEKLAEMYTPAKEAHDA